MENTGESELVDSEKDAADGNIETTNFKRKRIQKKQSHATKKGHSKTSNKKMRDQVVLRRQFAIDKWVEPWQTTRNEKNKNR